MDGNYSALPRFQGVSRQRGRGIGALAAILGRTAIPFAKKFLVPAAKRIGADLLEAAAPEIGNVITGKKKIKSFAKDVGKKTLRKQLGSGGKKRKKGKVIKRRKPTKNSRSRSDLIRLFENLTE